MPSRFFRFFAVIALALTAGQLASALFVSSINTESLSVVSPDRRWNAIVFDRHCEEPRRCVPITWVSIIGVSEDLPNGDGNAASMVDGGHNLTSGKANIDVRLEWKGNGTLVIWYPGPAKILTRKDRIGSVIVEYRPVGFL